MNLEVARKFIQAINEANVDHICALMTDDHLFIDSQDNRVIGKDNMREGWMGYFALFPDYKIEVQETFEKENKISLTGYASGTYKNFKNEQNSNHWRIPAAWLAEIHNGKIKQWQVFADNSVVIEIINRNK